MKQFKKSVKHMLQVFGSSGIGHSVILFLRYIEDLLQINVIDILDHYDTKKSMIKNMNRFRRIELLLNLYAYNANLITSNQFSNLKLFFDDCLTVDEMLPFFRTLLGDEELYYQADVKEFLNHFRSIIIKNKSKIEQLGK